MATQTAYTVEDVAERLGISRGLAYQLAREKRFPVIRLGKRFVVPADEFERWIAREAAAAVPK